MDMPAIVWPLHEHVEHDQRWRKRVKDNWIALNQRFLSGADRKFTPVKKSKELHCRIDGSNVSMVAHAGQDGDTASIASVDDEAGLLNDKYRYRREVRKVLAETGYKEEARR